MKRSTGIFLLSLTAVALVITATILNFNYDALKVEIINRTIQNTDGKSVNIPTYIIDPIYRLSKVISELLYTAGIALAIYLIIEQRLKRYENEEFSKNILSAILKKFVPDELFEILNNEILNKKIIRKDADWEYIITPTEQGYDLKQIIKHDIHNIDTKDTTDNLGVSLSQTYHNQTYFDYISIERKDKSKSLIWSKEKIDDEIQKGKELEKLITLTLRPREKASVTVSVMNNYFSKHVIDYHYSNYSCINLRIRVHKPANCTFSIYPTFPQKLELLMETDTLLIFKPLKGVLIGQGIVFYIDEEEKK